MRLIFTKRKLFLSIFLNIFLYLNYCNCDIHVSPQDLSIKLDEKDFFDINVRNSSDITIQLIVEHKDIVQINKSNQIVVTLTEGANHFEVNAIGAGHSQIYANNSFSSNFSVKNIFVRVTIYRQAALDTFSTVIGWIYFAAWSISFYPQIFINWKRKSVVGLNFDFIILNIVGFTLYSAFNLGLYAIPEIEDEYFNRYPRGLNPVKINDIVFAVHAAAATIVTIIQCFIYEREQQKVSITARCILGAFALFLTISAILGACKVIHWLDFLYYCSYVKLAITLIKYIPQAYMNYKRKSTIGWSIGNIFLDFTGGSLSMMQMIVDSYNYNDWVSIFGDPTKFGLGLFSVAFDIFFLIQHYILYRNSNYEEEN